MDLEQLTKHQIILLTLLVSFVTSIATGIVTVSLLSQAPISVTKTIQQIVERTVETVTPAKDATDTAKTVVIKDDDLAAQSIASVQKSIVRVVGRGGSDLVARGVIIDDKGVVLTDKAALESADVSSFDVVLANGTRLVATRRAATTTPFAVLDVAFGTTSGWGAVRIVSPGKTRLGQSVIRIGGRGADTVAAGVVAQLPSTESSMMQASVSSNVAGAILITTFGELLGMTTGASLVEGAEAYTPASLSGFGATAITPRS